MNIVCLDVEGVLVPEIWIEFSKASGIPELKRTTRDEPDYNKLMNWRLGILKEHGLGLKEIQATIAKIQPLEGAREFLDELRSVAQVILISDTFEQFASPLMEKLGRPTLFCNTLDVAEDGEITGFKMRIENSKLSTVKALQFIGEEVMLSGDPEKIMTAEKLVLPGVGSFGEAMENLNRRGLSEAVREAAAKHIPLMGICLGLQLLFERSEESPGIEGLGILPGEVLRIPDTPGLKVRGSVKSC